MGAELACFAFLIPAPLRLCFDPLQRGCNSTKDVTVTSRRKTFDAEIKAGAYKTSMTEAGRGAESVLVLGFRAKYDPD